MASRTPYDMSAVRAPWREAGPGRALPWRRYVAGLGVLDAGAMLAGALAVSAVRSGTTAATPGGVPYVLVAVAVAAMWVGVLAVAGAYEPRYLGSGSEEYRRVLSSAGRLLATVAVLAFALSLDLGRIVVLGAIPAGALGTLVQRYALRKWLHRQRAQGRFMRRVLVVGEEPKVVELARQVRLLPYTGLAVSAFCITDRDDGVVDVDGVPIPVVGGVEDLLGLVRVAAVDVVIVADRETLSIESLRELAWQVEGTDVSLLVAPEVTDFAGPFLAIRPVAGLPVLTVEEPALGGARHVLKETFDRAFAAVSLLVLLPGLLLVALVVRCSSPGPAIFKQVRIGLRGRRFILWKFRTMTVDAEEQRETLLHRNEHDGVLFKIRDDPRVTRVGRVLRRWSIDELPQLWNVARGEMSIVGPRPPLPAEVENYSHQVRRRLLVKPGMTGLWQISGRSGLPWEEAVRLDLHYVEHWSPALDLAILAKTASAVVRGDGAY